MSVVAQVAIEFVLVECCNCGVPFQMTRELNDRFLRHRHLNFYCPNGHDQHYLGQTEEQKLRAQLQCEKEARQHEENLRKLAENSNRVLRGHVTRARRRAAAGVCPCCKRSFANMKRHMDTKHSDYVKEAQA